MNMVNLLKNKYLVSVPVAMIILSYITYKMKKRNNIKNKRENFENKSIISTKNNEIMKDKSKPSKEMIWAMKLFMHIELLNLIRI